MAQFFFFAKQQNLKSDLPALLVVCNTQTKATNLVEFRFHCESDLVLVIVVAESWRKGTRLLQEVDTVVNDSKGLTQVKDFFLSQRMVLIPRKV